MINRRRLLLPWLFVTAIAWLTVPARCDEVSWSRDPEDPKWVRGSVGIPAPPTEVWAVLSDVDSWADTFRDVESLSVETRRQDGVDAVVKSASMTHPADWRIEVSPPDSLSFSSKVHGMTLRGEFSLASVEGESKQTLLAFSLYLRTSGFASLVGGRKARTIQEDMVVSYLSDMLQRFAGGGEPAP